jgi:hypothetical protein
LTNAQTPTAARHGIIYDMPSDEGTSPLVGTSVDVVSGVAAALAGLVIAGPFGAVSGAIAGPIAKASLYDLVSRIGRRREARVEFVIKVAAEAVSVPASTLIERMESAPEQEALLIRTLQAAQDEAATEHLVALALSLAKANTSAYSEAQLTWETAFVRAVADCDVAHVKLLASFTTTYNDLGLEDGAAPNTSPADGLNSRQLEIAKDKLQLGETLDYLLATLERLGLIRNEVSGAPAPPMITKTVAYWRITDFGKRFLQRMDEVKEIFPPPRT